MHIYEHLVETCVEVWESTRDVKVLEEAVEVAEAGRARRLMELLAEETLQPEGAPPDLIEQFYSLRRRLRDAEQKLQEEAGRPETSSHDPAPSEDDGGPDGLTTRQVAGRLSNRLYRWQDEIKELRPLHDASLQEIKQHDPKWDPDRPVPPLDFARIRAMLPTDVSTAAVVYTITEHRSIALVMTAREVTAVTLPEMSWSQAVEHANAWYRAYRACFVGRRFDDISWSRVIVELLEPIAAWAIRPVVDQLPEGIERLLLVPSRTLHLYPLHACTLDDGRYLSDAFEVAYAPSLAILDRCRDRRRPIPSRLLTVENPTADLAFPEYEAASIGRHFHQHERSQRLKVSREWLLENAAKRDAWHYTGHSGFNFDDPLASGLVLENEKTPDRWLTLRDVFTGLRLGSTTLAVLSSCESGSLRPDRIDDYLNMPAGFLYAGATAVVSSLWVVGDLASALLMERFYEEWLGRGRGIATALREAQRWLRQDIKTGVQLRDEIITEDYLKREKDPDSRKLCRRAASILADLYPDSPPFASPASWAAFTATGWSFPRSDERRDSSRLEGENGLSSRQ